VLQERLAGQLSVTVQPPIQVWVDVRQTVSGGMQSESVLQVPPPVHSPVDESQVDPPPHSSGFVAQPGMHR
jgi:hypothetical protein